LLVDEASEVAARVAEIAEAKLAEDWALVDATDEVVTAAVVETAEVVARVFWQ